MFYKIQKNEHEGANFFSTKMTEFENLGVFGLTLYNPLYLSQNQVPGDCSAWKGYLFYLLKCVNHGSRNAGNLYDPQMNRHFGIHPN
jgi:hypothetical protein